MIGGIRLAVWVYLLFAGFGLLGISEGGNSTGVVLWLAILLASAILGVTGAAAGQTLAVRYALPPVFLGVLALVFGGGVGLLIAAGVAGVLLSIGARVIFGVEREADVKPGHEGTAGPRTGEIWWADVPYTDSAKSKDRPCLVLEVGDSYAQVLKITSKDKSGRDDHLRLRNGLVDGYDQSWLQCAEPRSVPLNSFRRFEQRIDDETWHLATHLLGRG
ncbi:type II toxin-antitoxin system PemK/MazF family toxin [Nonomuraea sp. NPDC059194]|uniref:type II toxin-antitoxin system PemK/MazF family toxin n=1 Tax=Nonomuraea sp. NPDC059194 TaxID=3346764 RepID=UPI0036C42E25